MGTIGSTIANSALTSSGTGSTSSSGNGIDVQGAVDQILSADRAPEQIWQTQQATMNAQVSVLKAISTDLSTLQTNVQALSNLSGAFSSKSVSVSDSGILTATAGATAAAGSHTIVVGALASTSSAYTGYKTSSSAVLDNGSFSLQVGSSSPVPVTIGASNNTLDKLASSINNLNAGVTASVVTDSKGARLALVSNASGEAGNIAISSDTTTLGFTVVDGTNASLTVDGVPVSSASNTVSNVIPGVTLNLFSESASKVSINVQPDTTQATQAINSFVSSYNKVVGDINSQFQYNSSTQSAGVLSGDGTLRLLQQQIFSDVTARNSDGNSIQSLGDLGITLNNDGTMSADNSQIQSALSANYADVQNFFQNSSTGIAARLNSDLTNLTDPAQGSIALKINGLTQSSSDITDQINALEARLATTQQQLLIQYSQINATLEQLPMLLTQINAELGSVK